MNAFRYMWKSAPVSLAAGVMPAIAAYPELDTLLRTQVAAIITACWVALAALLFTGLLTDLPKAVLAAIIEMADREGRVLLARNAAWQGRMFALITGFMEAGETPGDGIAREVLEETGLRVDALKLVGVYDFQRMNQIIIAYHALAQGEIALSPELAEYKLFAPADVRCWRAGTGFALADWLRSRGHEPRFIEWPPRT